MRALLPVLWDGCTVLDYGCGRGEDVKRLRRMGIDVDGYDPHFFPNLPRKRYDIVNLGYVLNVIQDPSERARVLQQAWELTKVALLVSVRTDAPQKGWSRSGDGYLTGTGTFQKLYAGSELLQYASRLQGGTASGGTGRVVVLRHPIGQVSRR
jgi:DNA phosphorothioation-associated putative methyltransferase